MARELGVIAICCHQFGPRGAMAAALAKHALLLRGEVSEKGAARRPCNERWRKRPQLQPERGAGHERRFRHEEQQQYRRVPFESESAPLAQAVDDQVEIAWPAPGAL